MKKPAPTHRVRHPAPPSEEALRAWLRGLADGRPAADDDAWLPLDRAGPEANRPMRDLEW